MELANATDVDAATLADRRTARVEDVAGDLTVRFEQPPYRFLEEPRFADLFDSGNNDWSAAYNAVRESLPAAGGRVILGERTYAFDSPWLAVDRSGMIVEGAGAGCVVSVSHASGGMLLGDSGGAVTDYIERVELRGFKLSVASGHAIVPQRGLLMSTFNIDVEQNTVGKRWIHKPTGVGKFLGNKIRGTRWTQPQANTVAGIFIQGNSAVGTDEAINSNEFAIQRLYGNNSEPCIYLEETAASVYAYGNIVRACDFEIARGGLVHVYSGHTTIIERPWNWDMAGVGASTKDAILFSKSTSGPSSVFNVIEDYARINGSLGGSLYDIKFVASSAGQNTIRGGAIGTGTLAPSIDLGSTTGNVIDNVRENATVDNADASTMWRQRGTTSGRAPAIKFGPNKVTWRSADPSGGSEVWVRGDVVYNTAPSAGGVPGWVCTVAGTPGTWKAMAAVAA